MEYIGKFVDLFSGKLSEIDEKNLFAELSSNDVIRNEFKAYSLIAANITKNVESFAPSVSLKKRVFDKAGYKIDTGEPVPNNTNSNTGAVPVPFFKSRLFSVAAASLLSSILTLTIAYLLFAPHLNQKMDSLVNSANQTRIPKIESYETPVNTKSQNQKPIIKYVYIKESRKPVQSNLSASNIDSKDNLPVRPEIIEVKNPVLTYPENNSNNRLAENHMSDGFIPEIRYEHSIISNSNTLTGLEIDFSNNTAWNFPAETIYPQQYSKLNNMNLEILYKLSDNFKIGAGAKQETYYLVYQGTEGGSLFMYSQQPNFTTFSGLLRYTPFSIGGLFPYLQLNAGINSGGYVIKPSAGLEYHVNRKFTFMLGFDYSRFWFSHQGAWFSSSKAGLFYGISYLF